MEKNNLFYLKSVISYSYWSYSAYWHSTFQFIIPKKKHVFWFFEFIYTKISLSHDQQLALCTINFSQNIFTYFFRKCNDQLTKWISNTKQSSMNISLRIWIKIKLYKSKCTFSTIVFWDEILPKCRALLQFVLWSNNPFPIKQLEAML